MIEDNKYKVFMRNSSTEEMHSFSGDWKTFAEAASAAYQEKNKRGHAWKIIQISEIANGNNSLLEKLAQHLKQSSHTQGANVLNSLPSADRAVVLDLLNK